ncbi:DUF4402 domain-containing protein [Novosphingobium sp. TW-4]|uniref:DUF4402 domain-containing protein n=2 Tax=Novosphingobium olei TaxID=2728851 RepID=A0A7Y0GBI7_9SPHN|nr:DUF4402 domain-containing protein [Novosphingobium olei]
MGVLQFLLSAAGAVSFMHAADAQTSSVATGTSSADVVQPLMVTKVGDLQFGAVVSGEREGAVTVNWDGQTSYRGGTQMPCPGAPCGKPSPALFTIRGAPGASYSIELPSYVLAIGRSPAGVALPPLLATGLIAKAESRSGAGNSGQLDEQGYDRIQIGGTLILPARAAAGTYSADILVAVSYL